jgi:DNA invertase Pin-like site-specific DNA recombinase
MAIYGYCRVSTRGQLDGNSLEAQKEQILRDYPTAIIIEEQISGAKAVRPKFDELVQRLESGDMLVVTKLDRFARSVIQGSETVNNLIDRGVRVNILTMGAILDNTPNSRLIRNIFFSFAEFERDMIYERTQEGKALARQRGDFKEGRPRKFSPAKVDEALNYIESGNSFKKASEVFGISKTTLIRRMQERKANRLKEEVTQC